MELDTVPRQKKPKSPGQDAVMDLKNCITCTNVPEGLFDATAAKKHFSKFGRVQRIRLFPKRQMCTIEYDQLPSAERAVLNAGAFDGFMFDVTRAKPRIRKQSKSKEDDPDWLPDSDVEEELNAMSGIPTYRVSRQKPMDIGTIPPKVVRTHKQSPVRARVAKHTVKPAHVTQPSDIEPPVSVVTTQTSMNTDEAAAELVQLRSRVSTTPDEQWRILDARDRILRAWGGTGSKVKVGGATIGTCADMCPEKERLHRQAEHQVMSLEAIPDSDGLLEAWRAVKQYSRSSADQEMPMCYELRPPSVLLRTCAYLLHQIADTSRQVTLADWFHFMWDRFRGIRKDITQQALCCPESIQLVEMCARFHAHCGARLADLEHTQFDQKLNTDNLTKCLQTLKHMYADVDAASRPRESEFRGYIALLNLGDSNFWWEIKQLPEAIQKSRDIIFAIKIFNALDNNNYVRFFRLIRDHATYLQACILLRYFNDVRARALARMVKAYAPRGGAKYPAQDIMNALAFESVESMKSFINHYGLRFAKDVTEFTVILDRNQFIEDSDPLPLARSIDLIESKRQHSVGEVIAGGPIPNIDYENHSLYSSFNANGTLKDTALVAEDQGYGTVNDTNKDVRTLRAEVQRLSQVDRSALTKSNLFGQAVTKPIQSTKALPSSQNKQFSFKPAIPVVAPTEIIKSSPEKLFGGDTKNVFSFSKPQESTTSLWSHKNSGNLFAAQPENKSTTLFSASEKKTSNLMSATSGKKPGNVFTAPPENKTGSLFSASTEFKSGNVFTAQPEKKSGSLFTATSGKTHGNLFTAVPKNKLTSSPGNLFTAQTHKAAADLRNSISSSNVFGKVNNENKDPFSSSQNLFKGTSSEDTEIFKKSVVNDECRILFGQSNADNTDGKKVFGKQDGKMFATAPPAYDAGNNKLFSNAEIESNIFSKQIPQEPTKANIFGSFKPSIDKPNNVFAQAVNGDVGPQTIFASNGDLDQAKLSPGTLFKSAAKPSEGYSIFQSKNSPAQNTTAANIFNSVNKDRGDVYDFNKREPDNQDESLEQKRQEEEKHRQEEERRKQEEMIKEQQRRLEILRQKEAQRVEEERRLEEARRQEEARKKQEEFKKIEAARRREEQRKQEELRRKLEEERKLEILRLAAEEEKRFRERVDKESHELIDELMRQVNNEIAEQILREEIDNYYNLMLFADGVNTEITSSISSEICESEVKAEIFLTQRLYKKYFCMWRRHLLRNIRRRSLLNDTPVWLSETSPEDTAQYLRRLAEQSALKNMFAIHRGYRFSGDLKSLPPPEPLNIMEIIKTPFLKRMQQINYPYDKCFFWKLVILSPGPSKWLHRQIEINKWILDSFSDKKIHEESNTLIQLGKQSWNRLMEFAIAVSLLGHDDLQMGNEAVEGSNGLLFYFTEDNNIIDRINETLKLKYPYQCLPVAIILSNMKDTSVNFNLEQYLTDRKQNNIISNFRIFLLEPHKIGETLGKYTKNALKWLAKNCPAAPTLEIDNMLNLCQRYLGNEIWFRLRSERETRIRDILKDLPKLVVLYNSAVDKLTDVITNEDLLNFPSFPLEFTQFLDNNSPYPRPYEFISTNAKSPENLSEVRNIMRQLKLPNPHTDFNPLSVVSLQDKIRSYCNQISWFKDPEQVVCKVVAVLPTEFSDCDLPSETFCTYFKQYDLIDLLNILVHEKINGLRNLGNRFAVYDKCQLQVYHEYYWWHQTDVVSNIRHRALEYDDELDYVIEAKRRKIEFESVEQLMLEDKDSTLVEQSIRETDERISQYNSCTVAVKQLEEQLDEQRKRSAEIERMLQTALSDV